MNMYKFSYTFVKVLTYVEYPSFVNTSQTIDFGLNKQNPKQR